MKRRGEYEWSEVPYPVTTVGSSDTTSGTNDAPVAVLWVPDIDARHRWREYAIVKPGKPSRPCGFGKPGTP